MTYKYSRVLGMALLAAAQLAFAAEDKEPIGPEAAKALPIADVHFHPMSFMDPRILLERMDRHGIKWAGGAGMQGETEARRAEVFGVLGQRAVDATGFRIWLLDVKAKGGVGALEDAESPLFKSAYERIERDLQGGARVVGEIHVNSLLVKKIPILSHKIAGDAPTMKMLFALATKYGRVLNIHAQWDPDTVESVGRLAESNREGKLMLSHCGSTADAGQIRAFMEAHPNVYCDLSFRSPPQLKGPATRNAIFEKDWIARPWRDLIEDHADRFVVGTDDVFNWDDYDATAHAIRFGLLANLSPETAEKVAYKNAVALFGLEEPAPAQ